MRSSVLVMPKGGCFDFFRLFTVDPDPPKKLCLRGIQAGEWVLFHFEEPISPCAGDLAAHPLSVKGPNRKADTWTLLLFQQNLPLFYDSRSRCWLPPPTNLQYDPVMLLFCALFPQMCLVADFQASLVSSCVWI